MSITSVSANYFTTTTCPICLEEIPTTNLFNLIEGGSGKTVATLCVHCCARALLWAARESLPVTPDAVVPVTAPLPSPLPAKQF